MSETGQPGVDAKPASDPKAETKAPEYVPPTREEWEKVTKALAATNEEAKQKRLAAEAAEKSKLEAEGKHAELLALERKRAADLEAQVGALKPFETIARGFAEKRLASVPESLRAKLAALPIDQQVALADEFAAAAGTAPAKAPTTGAPAPPTAPAVNLAALTPDDVGRLSPAQKADVLAQRLFRR